ncbi:uncharacterized protein LOC122498924 [Leptopilina heterotoma]|uniref:uncharacterized protein LOC122498924 n=1 Tax=Leptopilina heterotoma TaxID=63436 RepID=UPI001CA893AA|nr:uncharacterized protein LOC122498924 [Leptopilina heterotoma]
MKAKPSAIPTGEEGKNPDGSWAKVVSEKDKRKKRKEDKKKQTIEKPSSFEKKEEEHRRHQSVDGRRKSASKKIIEELFATVNPAETETEVLSIRRTKKQDLLFVLKKGRNFFTFSSRVTEAPKEKASVSPLVTKRSLEISDLDETAEIKDVEEALKKAVDRTDLEMSCRLLNLHGVVKMAAVQLPDADADALLKAGKIKIELLSLIESLIEKQLFFWLEFESDGRD